MSLRAPRSLSLTARLLLIVAGSITVATVTLSAVAYRAVLANLDQAARSRVRVAAESRADAVSRVVIGQHQRAERFIKSTATFCGEQVGAGALAWESSCTRTALQEFRITEHAVGALLLAGNRRVVALGRTPRASQVVPTGLAVFETAEDGIPHYVIRAEFGQTSILLDFAMADFLPFFDAQSSLGTGDAFLRSAAGEFFTPPRYATTTTPIGSQVTEATGSCFTGAREWRDIDYRGIDTFHGVHPVAVVAGGACVDAHVTASDALAPAALLLRVLLAYGGILMALGLVVGLFASQGLAAPVLRLVAAARALENGKFDRPIRIEGASEVRELGRSLATMARALGEMVGRERRARQEAESANRAKDEFLAVLSHELRTPLTATLGWTRLLRTGHLDPHRSVRAIDAIERSALTQTRLVNDLLDVSRIISGRLRLDEQVLPLIDPVLAALDEVRGAADRKGVTIDTLLDPDVRVRGDAIRLQQIAENLVTNAVKFTPGGGHVIVQLTSADGHAELSVSDTGVGIAPSFLPFVFDRFRQGDSGPTSTHGGLGLGLAIVRHLVRLHGGSVQALSGGQGKGATFLIQLPLSDATATSLRQPPIERQVVVGRLDGARALVVEDDEDTRAVLKAMLEDVGAMVSTARSAEEARRTLRSWRPTILISDVAMPDEDGYEFIRSVRAAGSQVPAIALTAYARKEDAAAALAAGFQMHLPKPVNRSVLVSAIASLAGRSEAVAGAAEPRRTA